MNSEVYAEMVVERDLGPFANAIGVDPVTVRSALVRIVEHAYADGLADGRDLK